MISPKFQGIVNAMFRARVGAVLASYEGKEMEVVIRKVTRPRSSQQNKAYWGIAIELLCEHLGYSRDECHEAMKIKFASHVDERGLVIIESTSHMSTVRFNKYYEDIQQWAAEFLNFRIPSPNEVDLDSYY